MGRTRAYYLNARAVLTVLQAVAVLRSKPPTATVRDHLAALSTALRGGEKRAAPTPTLARGVLTPPPWTQYNAVTQLPVAHEPAAREQAHLSASGPTNTAETAATQATSNTAEAETNIVPRETTAKQATTAVNAASTAASKSSSVPAQPRSNDTRNVQASTAAEQPNTSNETPSNSSSTVPLAPQPPDPPLQLGVITDPALLYCCASFIIIITI